MSAAHSFSLTVLGTSPAFVNSDNACAGYLLRGHRTAVMLECGPGSVGKLRKFTEPHLLDAVVVSHLHADHYLDLVTMRYGLRYWQSREQGKLPVFLPPGGVQRLRRIGALIGESATFFDDVFSLEEYRPSSPLRIGPLVFQFQPVLHYVPSYGVRVRCENSTPGNSCMAYSADAGPCEELVAVARNADLFLCEATLLDAGEEPPGIRGHLTALEAGDYARRAGARRLLLTHFPESDDGAMLRVERASEAFSGPVDAAQVGKEYRV